MNALKTVVILSVLGVVGYGVYMAINNNPTTPPQDVADNFNKPQVEMPGSPDGMSMANTAGSYGLTEGVPGTGQSGGSSPPFYNSSNTSNMQAPPYEYSQTAPKAGGTAVNPGDTYPNMMTSSIEPIRNYPATTPGQPELGGVLNPTQPSSNTQVPNAFENFLGEIQTALREGRLAEAHERLGRIYSDPNLSPNARRQITDLLDQVTGTVIYSREHILEKPYTVQPGDTLQQIAQMYRVPWQMLGKINQIVDPTKSLEPGKPLKVLRGPVAAEIRLNDYQLTLRLGDRYAGRFQIGIGSDHANLEGIYVVREKILNPAYNGPNGTIPPEDPSNPLGERLIGLESQSDAYAVPVAIHGTNDPGSVGRVSGSGSIRLKSRDIDDLFNILSKGSTVNILR